MYQNVNANTNHNVYYKCAMNSCTLYNVFLYNELMINFKLSQLHKVMSILSPSKKVLIYLQPITC